ncbi:MAG TPA: xylulokinase [Acetobacteraceae bacterium]|nr:xylulokinase [Acetobacteraceae bacterium]
MDAIGIDLGTSGVKAVLIGEDGTVRAEATAPLAISHPHPLWSEQSPEDWWTATATAIAALRARADLSTARAIGLTGQMHGAVLLDEADNILRPAILWNDGRSAAECAALDPLARRIAGNLAMPGFTAPKLLWVRRFEPEIFAATARVLLPKDWLRLRITGEAISDMSDASGTLWLDVAMRRWSPALLAACGLSPRHMPRLAEGTEPAGTVRPALAEAWGIPPGAVVAAGGGDNAVAAIGLGCIAPGAAFLSLGTSGVVFVCDESFRPAPERAVHAFCHCLPAAWHRMAVILAAASSLAWLAAITGAREAALLEELDRSGIATEHGPIFLPYLAGERTPHNDPTAAGVFFGLESATTRADLTRAVLEGVAFALADGLDVLEEKSVRIAALSVTGGGAQSALWGRILAAALARPLIYHAGGEIGPALGAARLGLIAAGAGTIAEICPAPPIARIQEPESDLAETLAPRRALFRRLYPDLRAAFSARL